VLAAKFTSTHLSLFAPRIWNSSQASTSFVTTLLLSIFEPVSSILIEVNSTGDYVASSAITSPALWPTITACSHHISEPRDLTSRSHAVATILQSPFSYHFSSPAWSSLQLIIINQTSGYVVESLLSLNIQQ
jgi:hypothetical protein